MPKQKSQRWLTVSEAAKRLGMTRPGIYKAIKEGRLAARLDTTVREVLHLDPKSIAHFKVSASHQERGHRRKPR